MGSTWTDRDRLLEGGDSMFKSIVIGSDHVTITLTNGTYSNPSL